MGTRYSGYSASFNGSAYNQIRDIELNPGNSVIEITPNGMVDRGTVMTSHAAPMVGITTEAVATFLGLSSGAFASIGLACPSGAIIQFQRRASGGVFESTNHGKITATKGFLYPVQLAVQQDTTTGATLGLMFDALSEAGTEAAGLEPPLVVDLAATLTGTPAFTAAYFLGCAYIGGTEVPNLVAAQVDFGLNVTTPRFCGQPFARDAFITQRNPTISLTGESLQSTGLFGAALSGAGIELYLAKGAPGGTRVAGSSTVHIKISAATGAQHHDGVSARGNADGTTTLTIRPTSTLSVSTASALP